MAPREGQHACSARRGHHVKNSTHVVQDEVGYGGASQEGQHARSARRGGVWHHRKGSTHVVQDEVGCGITGRAAHT